MAVLKERKDWFNLEYTDRTNTFRYQSAPDKAQMIHYASDQASIDLLVSAVAGEDIKMSPAAIKKLRALGYTVIE